MDINLSLIETKIETIKTRTLVIKKYDLIALLQTLKGFPKITVNEFDIKVNIPGGRDYSNCSLRIEDLNQQGIVITWIEKS